MKELTFRDLRADEVDIRIGTAKENGVSLLLYKDARCDMNILDETVGPLNWQRQHEVVNGNLYCSVGIRPAPDGEQRFDWVWKQDVGTESNTEAQKGEASDSFKRACFNWGIGRELYTAPFIWISGAMKTDKFWVSDMRVENKKITSLVICKCNQYGDRTNEVAFTFPRMTKAEGGPKVKKEEPKEQRASARQIELLAKTYKGENLAKLLKANGIEKIEDLPMSKASELIAKLNARKEKSE